MLEFDRTRIKQTARQAMKLQHPHPMLVTFVFSAIAGIGGQIISRILSMVTGSASLNTQYAQAFLKYGDPDTALQYVLMSFGPQRLIFALLVGGGLASLLVALWQGLLRVGYRGFCLDMALGRQPQTGALYRAFPQSGPVLVTQLLAILFRLLWGIPLGVGAFVLIFVVVLVFHSLPALVVLGVLCAYAALLLGMMWVTLRYELVDFLMADQGLTGMDAIRESKRLMQGNYGKLFTLKLSFLGWYLLELGVLVAFAIVGVLMFGPQLAAAMDSAEALAALLVSMAGFVGLFALAGIAISVFNLWLTPYITGSEGLFYAWTQGIDGTRPTFGGGDGGWGQPAPPRQNTTYTWNPTPGQTSGTGIGPGPRDGRDTPKPPKSPKDDPWD